MGGGCPSPSAWLQDALKLLARIFRFAKKILELVQRAGELNLRRRPVLLERRQLDEVDGHSRAPRAARRELVVKAPRRVDDLRQSEARRAQNCAQLRLALPKHLTKLRAARIAEAALGRQQLDDVRRLRVSLRRLNCQGHQRRVECLQPPLVHPSERIALKHRLARSCVAQHHTKYDLRERPKRAVRQRPILQLF